MKKLILTLLLLPFFVSGCTGATSNKSELLGVWKLDTDQTLTSMRSAKGITPNAKDLFENDFFGDQIAEYREGEARLYLDRKDTNPETMTEFRPYQLVEENEDFFIIRYFDKLEQGVVTKKLYRQGHCYYFEVSKWGFNEYFCKANQ